MSYLLVIFVPLVYIGLPASLVYLAFRFLRAYEHRTRTRELEGQLHERLEALEDQVNRMALEQDRLAEGQQFTNSLLSGDAQRTPRSLTTPDKV